MKPQHYLFGGCAAFISIWYRRRYNEQPKLWCLLQN